MIRTIVMLMFWSVAAPVAALIGFPWTFITGDIRFLYAMFVWGAFTGVRMSGVRVQAEGLEHLRSGQNYIYMSNHVSNLDPPILIRYIPGRTSVMVKKELFKYPILGQAMHMGSLVPVDRGNRDAGIDAVNDAKKAIQQGLSMMIYIEGKRSFDGKLLPFKKGPFYLAIECGIPVVPVTIVGTFEAMPKGRFAVKPGLVRLVFHEPIQPKDFGGREELMEKVRAQIESGLPEQYRS